jgi:hypothetical protein
MISGGAVVHWCSKHGMLWWMRRLLTRAHPWPHRDGVGLGIVQGGPCWGVATPTVIVGATTVVALAFPLALALTLVFVIVVGGGGRGRGAVGGLIGCC